MILGAVANMSDLRPSYLLLLQAHSSDRAGCHQQAACHCSEERVLEENFGPEWCHGRYENVPQSERW